MKNKTLRILLLLALLVPGLCAATPDRPSILFIAIGDFRPELGCYGAPQVKTPPIDRLAGQGMRLTRAYSQVSTCGASLMTSILPTPTPLRRNSPLANAAEVTRLRRLLEEQMNLAAGAQVGHRQMQPAGQAEH